MANTQLLDTPWLDILPPPAPADHNLLIALVAIGLVTMIMIGVYYIWICQPRQRAMRALRKLQQRLDTEGLDNKQCLFEINRLLRQWLATNRLPCLDNIDWQAFYKRLIQRQYQSTIPTTDDTRQLIRDALGLLRRFKA